ncbi:hypothetical protein VTK73DRAFT_3730 [Phialemonium thermophilum]|uniref:Uncharacterized protein n=1 Tax=Phialemonium thermophilum TaxID=223376 RepID=A0ABR3VFC3_9PEZI
MRCWLCWLTGQDETLSSLDPTLLRPSQYHDTAADRACLRTVTYTFCSQALGMHQDADGRASRAQTDEPVTWQRLDGSVGRKYELRWSDVTGNSTMR